MTLACLYVSLSVDCRLLCRNLVSPCLLRLPNYKTRGINVVQSCSNFEVRGAVLATFMDTR